MPKTYWQYKGARLPGIAAAKINKKTLTSVDADFCKRKEKLGGLLPLLLPDDFIEYTYSPTQVIEREVIEAGYGIVADEIKSIVPKYFSHENDMEPELWNDKKMKIIHLADKVSQSARAAYQGDYENAAKLRVELGDKYIFEGNLKLARHFYVTAFSYSNRSDVPKVRNKIQALCHCMIAVIYKNIGTNEDEQIHLPLRHLESCRNLSKNMDWRIKPKLIQICIEDPTSLIGASDDLKCIQTSTKTVYNVACLIEHDILLKLEANYAAKQQWDASAKEDRCWILQRLVNLSQRVNDAAIVYDARIRYGLFLLEVGKYFNAYDQFHSLYNLSEAKSDFQVVAIACNLMGRVLNKKGHKAVPVLRYFALQNELALQKSCFPLVAQAHKDIGIVLLQEGELSEAKECFHHGGNLFKLYSNGSDSGNTKTTTDQFWVFDGIASALEKLQRYCNTFKKEEPENLQSILAWKFSRKELHPYLDAHIQPETTKGIKMMPGLRQSRRPLFGNSAVPKPLDEKEKIKSCMRTKFEKYDLSLSSSNRKHSLKTSDSSNPTSSLEVKYKDDYYQSSTTDETKTNSSLQRSLTEFNVSAHKRSIIRRSTNENYTKIARSGSGQILQTYKH